MEKGAADADEVGWTENLGGSTRVNDEAVRRLLRMPMRLRVGERPAGAESVEVMVVVLSFGAAGDRGWSIGREEMEADFTGLVHGAAKSLNMGAALVSMNVDGLKVSVPSWPFVRLGEAKMMGSMFSESSS
jgi:hypothetical protein